MRRLAVLAVLLPAVAAADARVDRLVRVAKVWGLVAHFHPWLRTRDLDWDAQLLRALPKVAAATRDRDVVAAMLDELGDPATRVAAPCPPEPRPPASRWLEEGVLLVERVVPAAADLPRARAVVIDLRARCAGEPPGELEELVPRLLTRPVRGPGQRVVEHRGYRTQTIYGGYTSGALVSDGDLYQPAPGARPRRVVFLVNRDGALPASVVALQQSGDAWLVAEGRFGDAPFAQQQRIELDDGWRAFIRTGELVNADGTGGVTPDVVAAPGDAALEAALRLARHGGVRRPRRAGEPLPAYVWRPDRTYPDADPPSLELRLLALFRYWNVIRYHYAYKHLLGDWESVLRTMIPVFEAAGDMRAYVLATRELGRLVGDAHSGVSGPAVSRILGEAVAPLQVRFIEGRPIVTRLLGEAPGVEVGDELLAIDGVPASARTRWLERYVPASNAASRARHIAFGLLTGADGSTVVVTVAGARGSTRRVSLVRRKDLMAAAERDGEIVRILPGNLGYIDLDRLEAADLDAALEKVKETRGLILDMRGYPHGVFRTLGSRLNSRHAPYAAEFHFPLVTAGDPDLTLRFLQAIPATDKWIYDRPSLMLIDERTMSQAEHTGLFLEMAAGTRFVGSPTAGTDGGVTIMTLPGGLGARMTGGDVRHADGRQLQRIGLVPDIPVRPTIDGIRAGRDEVLERAIQELAHP